jgi:hypothetical protein
MKAAFVVAAAFFGGRANAECANACSGKGVCANYKPEFSTLPDYTWTVPSSYRSPSSTCDAIGANGNEAKKDTCVCFTTIERGVATYAFKGADCSKRVCPSGTAFAATPYKKVVTSGDTTVVHNQYLECSGKGECDTKTGQCKCYDGYTGKACERTTCPNDCSGQGVCTTIKQIARDLVLISASFYDTTTVSKIMYDNSWDADKIRGCICDKGFFGPDCSKQECPSGVDPMGGRGAESGKVCSGRGSCDHSSGVCQCYKGFKGNKCQTQSSLAQ